MAKTPTRRPHTAGAAQRTEHSAVDVVHQTRTEMRSGPIPSPQELFAYDKLSPGLADRIVSMAEREQAHRMNLDDMTARADIRHRDEMVQAQRDTARGVFLSDLAGQTFGLLLAGGCVVGAVYTAVQGVYWPVPVAFLSLPVASIIKAVRATRPSAKSGGKPD